MNQKNKTYLKTFFIAVTVLAVANMLFFWKIPVKHLLPLPADIVVGAYYPWLDYKWGYQVGVPVKNPLISDVVSQNYPYKKLLVDLVKRGEIPLWNMTLLGGFPLIGNFQMAVFNPTNLLYLILSFNFAWAVQIMLQPWLAGIFMFVLLKSYRLNVLSALTGSIIYAFSGYMLIWLEFGVHGYAIACLPLMLFFLKAYLNSNNIIYGVLFSLVVCLQFFSGYPQITIYSLFILGLYTLYRGGFRSVFVIKLALLIIFGFVLASIQLLPGLELLKYSQRVTEVLGNREYFLPWQSLALFLSPDIFGNPSTGNYWGPGNYTKDLLYFGSGSIVLFIIGLITIDRRLRTERNFFLIVFVLTLIYCFPNPVSIFVKNLNLLKLSSSSAVRSLFLVPFSGGAIAAFGLENLFRQKMSYRQLRFIVIPIIMILGLMIGFLVSKRVIITYPGYTDSQPLQVLVQNLNVGIRNLLLPTGLTFGVTFLIFIANYLPGKRRRLACLLAVALITVELFRFGWKFNPFTPSSLVFPKTPVIDFLVKEAGFSRVEGGDVVPMNFLMAYGLSSFSGYDPIYPKNVAEYLGYADNQQLGTTKSRYAQFNNYNSGLFDRAGVCYLLGLKRDKEDRPAIAGKLSYRLDNKKFSNVFEDKSVVVLKNDDCSPFYYLTRNYRITESQDDFLIKTSQLNDPGQIVLVTDPSISTGPEEIESNEAVNLLESKNNKLIYKVQLNKPAILVTLINNFFGWQASIDGQPVKIITANYIFQSVALPAGNHQVTLSYQPLTFKYGCLISLSGVLLFLTIVIGKLSKNSPFKL